MAKPVTLVFESRLPATGAAVWEWITSVRGISTEMWPFFRMTVPRDIRSLADVDFHPGRRLFRSRVFLFGIVPIDYSDLTLLELTPGNGFVEQSPMGSMKLWRHERRIQTAHPGDVVTITDRLTFESRWASGLVVWFIKKVFQHRHAVLRRHFGGDVGDRAGLRADQPPRW